MENSKLEPLAGKLHKIPIKNRTRELLIGMYVRYQFPFPDGLGLNGSFVNLADYRRAIPETVNKDLDKLTYHEFEKIILMLESEWNALKEKFEKEVVK